MKYSMTAQEKCDLLIQVTTWAGLSGYFNTGDCWIEVTTWVGLSGSFNTGDCWIEVTTWVGLSGSFNTGDCWIEVTTWVGLSGFLFIIMSIPTFHVRRDFLTNMPFGYNNKNKQIETTQDQKGHKLVMETVWSVG